LDITLRKAVATDKERIAEISSQIWEGDDYVANVFDDWFADPHGEVIVATLDDILIGFARRTYLLPGYAWFEGIRTDPAYRNRGAAKAITRHFLDTVKKENAERIGLSTYIDNEASLHIIAANGFTRVASYVYLEADPDAPVRRVGRPSNRIVEVAPREAIPFINGSDFLQVAHGHFPHGWKFYPFKRDPGAVLAKMRHSFGIRESGRLLGLLCVGRSLRHEGEYTIDFIDGEPEAIEELLVHALHLARDYRVVELMAPKSEGKESPALPILHKLGFESWNDFQADVFVYERAL
jgi:RimJ/RimL family protein N-acetyltransferase